MACPFKTLRSLFGKNDIRRARMMPELTGTGSDTALMEAAVTEPGDIPEQIKLVSLTESDAEFAAGLAKLLEPSMDEIADRFYAMLMDNAGLKNLILEHSTVERLKKTLTEHIRTMLNIRINDQYITKRKAVARKHIHIGLQSKWYIGSFGILQNILRDIIVRSIADHDLRIRALEVVTKLLNFEQQIVLDTYETELNRKLLSIEKDKKLELYEVIGVTTEELAALSRQTSASIEEVISRIDHVTSREVTGNRLSESSFAKSEQGALVVHELTSEMNEVMARTAEIGEEMVRLKAISEEITGIIGMVREIADQTNILALNATIEAARAGEHGRGFHVVASEIRKLSDQTKKAAEDISGLIRNSLDQVAKVTDGMQSIDDRMKSAHRGVLGVLGNFQDIRQLMADMKEASEAIARELENSLQNIHDIGAAAGRVAQSAAELMDRSRQLIDVK